MWVVASVVAVAACSSEPASRDRELVKDRMWIDHIPQHERDRMEVFVAITDRPRQGPGPRGPLGVFEKIGPWEGHFQAFRYESHGDEMRIVFPQTGERETLRIKAAPCQHAKFDYCLDIEGSSHGVKRYYSRKGWDIRALEDVHVLARDLK